MNCKRCLFRRMSSAPGWAAVLYVALAPTAARAELQVVEEQTDDGQLMTYKMTVTLAPEPSPALKYRLAPSEIDLRPGNAALYYTRAFTEAGVSGRWKGVEKEYGFDEIHGGDQTQAWYNVGRRLDGATLDKARQAASAFDSTVDQFVARGTVRRDCDWGHNADELKGFDIISLLLPEIQESRSLSRALMLRTRVAIADGDVQKAIDHLRMNYRLAENVAKGSFLISGLVGIAQANMSNACVIELIARKESPNLYWALTELPKPIIDMRTAVRFEMTMVMRMFPFMANAEEQEHSPEEWSRLLAEGFIEAQQVVDFNAHHVQDRSVAQLAVTGLALVTYPNAKQRLIASGMDAARVEEMPVGQVVTVDASREYRRLADGFEKWWYVPYPAGKGGEQKADLALEGGKFSGGYGRMLAQLLLPALQAARSAQVRLEWQLSALQVVEAIRMHAAEAGGLPSTLEEITVVPLPENPATGKPYQYRLDGGTAVLELPFSDGFPGVAWRFEITLADE